MKTRRQFLAAAPAGLLAASTVGRANAATPPPPAGAAAPAPAPAPAPEAAAAPAGAPPTFGAGPAVGPTVVPATFAEAEKLAQVAMSATERDMAAASWASSMAALLERRTGPRRVALDSSAVPASRWNPASVPAAKFDLHDRFVRGKPAAVRRPAHDKDIAYAPLTQLARWIEARTLRSEELTHIYLDRIQRFDPTLRCVITPVRNQALLQAKKADREIASGRYRGPLHGIPYGVKDLLDTAGIATTYGAEPFRNRVPASDAAVVSRLNAAGAVLVAKLSLGALALNDIWFGGQTMNPWLPEEGASGSSAGPAAATAAALVGFAIGSETGGSIVSPAMRCGVTGLRPTFGRVPRTGAMTLCWSLDKLGPMTRSVEDAMLVLRAIAGPDAGDLASVAAPLDFNANAPVKGLRVGYVPAWMDAAPATAVDREALAAVKSLGMVPTPVTLPDWPYQSLDLILFAEAAAAFEDLTLDGRMNQLRAQVPDAWPNLFREARFLSAVDLVQADRLRRRVALEMARVFAHVDVLLVPSLRDDMLTISNHTGHPSLTLRTGWVEVAEARSDWAPDPAHPLPTFAPPRRVPYGVTFIGRLFDEGLLARVGMALEKHAGVAAERPPGYQSSPAAKRSGSRSQAITASASTHSAIARSARQIRSYESSSCSEST